MTVLPLGDSAVVIVLGTTVDEAVAVRTRAVAAELERHRPPGLVDIVPAFASVGLFFDSGRAPIFETLREPLEAAVARADAAVVSLDVQTIEVPVCYGGEFGPDLADVATHTQLSEAQVTALHAHADYLVHAIGFAPGFPYLGGLPKQLATPRRATPRLSVPAGAVAIGGAQTGIYSVSTPGGWNIIGRTPLALFDVMRDPPALLRAGDRVKFRTIDAESLAANQKLLAGSTVNAERLDLPAGPRLEVVRAGMFTTVQDLGRTGWRASGVPVAGAADPFALRVANSLVGNPEGAAALEFTLVGPELRFTHDTVVAMGGADFGAVPEWRPLKVEAGATLNFGQARNGCRGYLAIAGGVDVAPVLGSRSTYTRAALGGFQGRTLHDGDAVPIRAESRQIGDHWRIDERILPAYSGSPTVRVVSGAHVAQFSAAWSSLPFRISSRSDRMGLRLTGGPVARHTTEELLSLPVAPGTIQVPPDGQPIVLLSDAQTVGGYPQIAHVISVDLPLIAQLRPGDSVRFVPVSLDQAHELIVAQERAIALLREGLAQKLA
jgi:KipI family sensor histidine kinase inhibitor